MLFTKFGYFSVQCSSQAEVGYVIDFVCTVRVLIYLIVYDFYNN